MLDQSVNEVQKSPKPLKKNYTVLNYKTVVEGIPWSTEWLLSEYLQCTDGLIGKMDGTIPLKGVDVYVKHEDGLKKEKRDLPPPSSVIYLDKSARPVSWMVHELWPVLARTPGTPYSEGKIPVEPRRYFLNIDKKKWLNLMSVPPEYIEDAPDELVDVTNIDKEQITRIRALYSTVPIDEDNLEEAWNHPTILDGQHVMIVDEVISSGQTLKIAQGLLSMAIPEATFSGQYWAKPRKILLNNGVPDQEGRMQFKRAWVPVWYSKDVSIGRGVENRDEDWAEKRAEHGHPESNTRISRVGRYILSTPPHDTDTYERERDPRAEELREDIKLMAQSLKHGDILFQPHKDRYIEREEDAIDRIEAINKISLEDWQKRRKALEPKKR